jgi:hypothetical protein
MSAPSVAATILRAALARPLRGRGGQANRLRGASVSGKRTRVGRQIGQPRLAVLHRTDLLRTLPGRCTIRGRGLPAARPHGVARPSVGCCGPPRRSQTPSCTTRRVAHRRASRSPLQRLARWPTQRGTLSARASALTTRQRTPQDSPTRDITPRVSGVVVLPANPTLPVTVHHRPSRREENQLF